MLVLGQWELPQKCEMTKYHEFYQLIILKDDIASRKFTNDILNDVRGQVNIIIITSICSAQHVL